MRIARDHEFKKSPNKYGEPPYEQYRISALVRGTNVLAIVGTDGFENGKNDSRFPTPWQSSFKSNGNKGFQVRLSANGPVLMTKAEWAKLRDAIDESLSDLLD